MKERTIHKSFEDGALLRKMDINGPYIILRVYLDAFACNNPIGSSTGKHKVLGFYYSAFGNLKVASKRSTIQTIALVLQNDINHFGLRNCLSASMSDLKKMVMNGLYDKRLNVKLAVRVICCLGDNLGQNEVAGLRLNFSTMLHCCRKCLVSLDDLRTCDTYEDIHADYHESRTDEMLFENYQESLEKNVLHINGVWTQSLFKDFPYFNTCHTLSTLKINASEK